jgi:hypothetical protein
VSAPSSQRGYALLAALVVTALAALFAATAVAAVSARQSIMRADVAGARAQTAAREALASVCLELRRRPSALAGELSRPGLSSGDAGWQASWVAAAGAGVSWPAAVVQVVGSCGEARRGLAAIVQLRAAPVPQGLVVAHDVELQAPLLVSRSGMYSGGCVRGREWLDFGSVDPADSVHGDQWPLAGVHALGGVWAAGEEIHATTTGSDYSHDTDMHSGDADVARWVAPPDASLVVTLRDVAVAPGPALEDGTLDLSRLPLSSPLGAGSGSGADGYVVVATVPEGAELRLVGARPPGACPIALVVQGATAMGDPAQPTAFAGALLVLGSLHVCGPSMLGGHLFAEDLLVSAPLTVAVAGDWRLRPLAGLVSPEVVSLDVQ